jgi:hypothetical protein
MLALIFQRYVVPAKPSSGIGDVEGSVTAATRYLQVAALCSQALSHVLPPLLLHA